MGVMEFLHVVPPLSTEHSGECGAIFTSYLYKFPVSHLSIFAAWLIHYVILQVIYVHVVYVSWYCNINVLYYSIFSLCDTYLFRFMLTCDLLIIICMFVWYYCLTIEKGVMPKHVWSNSSLNYFLFPMYWYIFDVFMFFYFLYWINWYSGYIHSLYLIL